MYALHSAGVAATGDDSGPKECSARASPVITGEGASIPDMEFRTKVESTEVVVVTMVGSSSEAGTALRESPGEWILRRHEYGTGVS